MTDHDPFKCIDRLTSPRRDLEKVTRRGRAIRRRRVAETMLGGAVLFAIGLLAFNVIDRDGPPTGGVALPPGECATGGGSGVVDWADFIRVEGILYSGDMFGSEEVTKADAGKRVGFSRCQIQDVVNDPHYDVRDGDAAFLKPGTPLYRFRDYSPSFRLVARRYGEWTLYEAERMEGAEVASDFLDYQGRVDSISVRSPFNQARLRGPVADELTDLLLSSPVEELEYDPDTRRGRLELKFHLRDGTVSHRALYPRIPAVQEGVMVPQHFVEIIKAELQGGGST